METATVNVRAIKFHGYKIELSTNYKGKPVARLFKFITVGKNKDTWKLNEGFYFSTEEKRQAWVNERINTISSWEKQKAQRKDLKKSARANMVNPYKVGQVLYDSWGYEQTNIDFYQVTEVKEKSVVIRKIGQNQVEGSHGFMCENVTPAIDKFISEPIIKPLQVQASFDGTTHIYINGYRGSISLYNAGEKGLYQSHYA